jgi:branched-chain amino acid transport system permease protein
MTWPIPANRLRPALGGWAVISILLLIAMFAVRSFGSNASERTFVVFLVNVALVISLQVFIGNSGIVSFGHVAFMGIGAYATALVTIPHVLRTAQLPELPSFLQTAELGLVPAMVVSALVAVVVAAVFGGAVIRMTESTMAMATLALLVVVHTFLQNATTFTRGSLGLAGVPVRTKIEIGTAAAILFVLLGRLYKESGPGLRLRATREDSLSAAALGTNVIGVRYGSWLLSAGMMGAAGSLWAQSVIAFNANQFYFAITFALLAMLVIGGRTSVSGAVAGAAIITFLTDSLARVEQGVRIGPWTLPRISGTVQFGPRVCSIDGRSTTCSAGSCRSAAGLQVAKPSTRYPPWRCPLTAPPRRRPSWTGPTWPSGSRASMPSPASTSTSDPARSSG